MKALFRSRLARFAVPAVAAVALIPLAAPGANADDVIRNPNGCNVFVTIQTSWNPPMEETHDLGGCVLGQPVLNDNNYTGQDPYVFGIGTDGALWYDRANDIYGRSWTGWRSLGGRLTGGLRTWSDTSARVGVGGTGLDGQFWCTWNWGPNSDNWVSWQHC